MRTLSAASLVLLALALLCPPAAGAEKAKFLLAGNEEALWLLRESKGEGFEVVAKPTGAAWKWLLTYQRGPTPVAACASGDRLYVLFPSGLPVYIPLKGEHGQALEPDDALWPKDAAGTILIDAADPSGKKGAVLFALAPRPYDPESSPRRAPQSAPATRPVRLRLPAGPAIRRAALKLPAGPLKTLGIFRYDPNAWSHPADIDLPMAADSVARVKAAFARSRLHVYVPGERGLWSLSCGEQGEWKSDIGFSDELGELLEKGEVLSLLAIKDDLVFVIASPVEQGDQRHLHLASLSDSSWRIHRVGRAGEVASFPADNLPMVCRLAADRIALLSPADGTLKFASSDRYGKLEDRKDVDIFRKRPPDVRKAQEVLEYYTWGLLIAAVIPMFILRPRAQRGPFMLPERRLPGNLLKRLAAAAIDTLPFFFIAVTIFRPPPPSYPAGGLEQLLEVLSLYGKTVEAVYAQIAGSVSYVVYCTFTELRFGATPGKMLLKLRVVNNAGVKPSLREAFLRNVLKLIEMSLPFGVLLLLLPVFNRNRLRLGDMLARTAVIEAVRLGPPPPPPPRPDESEGAGRDEDRPHGT